MDLLRSTTNGGRDVGAGAKTAVRGEAGAVREAGRGFAAGGGAEPH